MRRLAACVALLATCSAAVASAADGPPRATATVGTHTIALTRGSYCWGTQCVDMIPPANRSDIVRLRVPKDAVLTVRLGFVPTSLGAGIVGSAARTLPPRRTATWRVTRGGILGVYARAQPGSASYLVRLVLR